MEIENEDIKKLQNELIENLKKIAEYKKQKEIQTLASRKRLADKIKLLKAKFKDRIRVRSYAESQKLFHETTVNLLESVKEYSRKLETDAIDFCFCLAAKILEIELSENSACIYRKLKRLRSNKIFSNEDSKTFISKTLTKPFCFNEMESLELEDTKIQFINDLGKIEYEFCNQLKQYMQLLIKEVKC